MRLLVYRYGVADGEEAEEQWAFMLKKYMDELEATEKDKLLYGLTQVQNVEFLKK